MCGIVGYIGKRNATPIILEGIKRLEYRGYDSSGIAILNDENELKIFKKAGKIIELERALPAPDQTVGNVGIAHTRWATHGKPNTLNAHPHTGCDGAIAVVHNGIIENYKNLRTKLESEGHKFKSDTDTEVLAQLIEHFSNDKQIQLIESHKRHCKDDGYILIAAPRDGIGSKLFSAIVTYEKGYQEGELENLLKGNGLEIVREIDEGRYVGVLAKKK